MGPSKVKMNPLKGLKKHELKETKGRKIAFFVNIKVFRAGENLNPVLGSIS